MVSDWTALILAPPTWVYNTAIQRLFVEELSNDKEIT